MIYNFTKRQALAKIVRLARKGYFSYSPSNLKPYINRVKYGLFGEMDTSHLNERADENWLNKLLWTFGAVPSYDLIGIARKEFLNEYNDYKI